MSSPATPSVERRLSGFLSLAPTTSSSYPQTQRSRQQRPPKPADGALAKRRSSSVSSSDSATNRFLKLGPVHWGEHMEDHQGDFAVE